MPHTPAHGALPRISVVTPSYNQGRFLEQCIRSVLNQEYPDLEYIIIDGGSSDNSVEIIRKYQANITHWVSEPDRGQSDALNKGFGYATGGLVAWLNSDDFYLPETFHRVAKAYQAVPTAPFFFGNGLRVDAQGKPWQTFFPKGSLYFNRDALRFGLNYILQPATFINSQSLNKVGGLSITHNYGLDTDLWLRLSALGDPVPVHAQLAASREYDTTKSSSGSFDRIEELRNIAENHTAVPITPGVICYFLDTLYRLAQEENDIFPAHYQRDILRFWGKTSLIMSRFGAGPDGFPLPPSEQGSFLQHIKRASKVYLRNFIKGHPSLRNRFVR